MATIGSLGVGSGLELNGLLEQIAAAERAPLNAIKARQAAYNTRLSAYGTLQGLLGGLQTAAAKLGNASFMDGYKSSSSDGAVLTVASSSAAVAGSYKIEVTRLAQAQTLVSDGVASTSAGIGTEAATLTIDFGSISGTLDEATGTYAAGAAFAVDTAKTSISVSLDAGATSLEAIRAAINKASNGAVTASIVNDGGANRLLLSSAATGQATSMRIRVGGDNQELKDMLGHDPEGSQKLRQTIAAQDAALSVNGLAVTSATNTVAESIQGVTLSVLKTGSSTVKVERDSAAVESAIKDFVSAYNKLQAKLKELTAYNSANKTGGVLLGDSTARAIQARLHNAFFEAHAGQAGDPARLSEIGVSFKKDGSLEVDASALSAALTKNAAGITRLFAGNEHPKTTGIAARFSSLIDGFTADKTGEKDDGLLTIATAGIKKTVTSLDKDYATAADRVDAKIAIVRTQFQQLDTLMSSLTATSNYLTQQFAKQTTK